MAKIIKITKAIAGERLADVTQEKQFWCSDGRVLKNLPELKSALEQMSEDIFRYHSNETRSDFGNWVRDVIGDDKLSRDLQKSKTQAQAAKAIADRVDWLKSRAEVI
jgi:hypothetical protein